MPIDRNIDLAMREALFDHMDRLVNTFPEGIPASELQRPFTFDDFSFRPLQQAGIYKPSALGREGAAVVLTSSIDGPYQDVHDRDSGFLTYKYQGGRGDEDNHYNQSLRQAIAQRLPLLYLCGIAVNTYLPLYPAYIVADNRSQLSVNIQVVERSMVVDGADTEKLMASMRAYSTTVAKRRLHQTGFRRIVMKAYQTSCAMCRLKISDLLDAAHIIPDGDPNGDPIVQNGMSLCKIHHKAYDMNIIGVTPDYGLEVNSDVLHEVDGPMLKHGIQELHGTQLHIPRRVADRPDPERLDDRYQKFLG